MVPLIPYEAMYANNNAGANRRMFIFMETAKLYVNILTTSILLLLFNFSTYFNQDIISQKIPVKMMPIVQ